ncbi:hypothetical protein [Sulfurimonas marina]|uniref:Uncharacterized protein n=1 Tax=Sulfurimonas marina TaxID=2590551 RepID=A0A7M1AVE9_9BACT|nr:hypothetical protein [Sulfurimonas marina]QOP41431.1 hypothetical protein FJR03_06605 [Sulfurimonas marina]
MIINKKVMFIKFCFIILFLSSCGENSLDKNTYMIHFEDYSFDIESNSFVFDSKIILNPYEVDNNDNYLVYSAINIGDEPELYIYDKRTKIEKQITNNDFIEFSPVVNKNGDFAYLLSELFVSKSKVFFNNIELNLDEKLYKNLLLSETDFIFNDDENNIYFYDIDLNLIKIIKFDHHIEKFLKITNKLLIQYYSENTESMDIGVYNLDKNSFNILYESTDDELLVKNSNKIMIHKISSNQKNIKLFFNALYIYYNDKLANPFSLSNNFLGRVGWNQSEKLEELIDMYQTIKDERIRKQIDLIVENLLNITNLKLGYVDVYNNNYSYTTKKYSLDNKTKISFLVHDSKIYYALLRYANEFEDVKPNVKAEIINNVESIYKFYEKYYDNEEKHYKFQYGMPYKYDGVLVPYNMQNSFALMLIELYIASGNEVYKNRLLELASKFKSEWVYIDNKILWHYMPLKYYDGWNEDENQSVHLPSKNISVDTRFEDTAHAGLNVKFIVKFHQKFTNEIFDESDIDKINNTLNDTININGFAKYINVLDSANYFSYKNFNSMKIGWTLLNNEKLKSKFVNLTPNNIPNFDNITNSYIQYVNRKALLNEDLIVEEITLDQDLIVQGSKFKSYNFNNIITYFEY